jgi:hypothetical protein
MLRYQTFGRVEDGHVVFTVASLSNGETSAVVDVLGPQPLSDEGLRGRRFRAADWRKRRKVRIPRQICAPAPTQPMLQDVTRSHLPALLG